MFLSRKKNRKWFSSEVSRVRGGYVDTRRASDPIVVATGVFVALVCAIISGRVIDYRRAATDLAPARYSIAPGAMTDGMTDNSVHYMNDSRFPAESRRPEINSSVMSQSEGAVADTVDSTPLVLLPSLTPGFTLNTLEVLASLDRPGTFVELSLGGGSNGSYVVRLNSTEVATLFLLPSGERTLLETLSVSLSGVPVLLTPTRDGVQVSEKSGARTILSGVDLRSGRVAVSTNLRQSELCRIVGSWGTVQALNLLTGSCKPPLSHLEPEA